MAMGHRINVALVVMTGDGFFLVDGAGIPNAELPEDGDSRSVAGGILKRATGLADGEWAIVRQVGFVDGDASDYPAVLYSVELPERTFLRDGDFTWVDFDGITQHPSRVQGLIGLACMYRKC